MKYFRGFIERYIKSTEDYKKKTFNLICISSIILFAIQVVVGILYDKPFYIQAMLSGLLVGAIGLLRYANRSKNYEQCYMWICILISILGLPSLLLMSGRYHNSAICSSANYYYVIGIVLPFLMLEGKCLYRFVIVEVAFFLVTYLVEYLTISNHATVQLNDSLRYGENVAAVVIVGLTLGAEFYYQLKIYQKKHEENEKQKVMLEQVIEKMNAAKQEAEEAKREAEDANKAKSEFLANISHEIRTPMNAILGMATLIERDDINMKVRERVEHIENATRSLLTIVNDILDISKIESGKMKIVKEEYQPASLINDIINMIQYQLEDRPITLKTNISNTLPCELYGDAVRMRQIIVNLLSNAAKYTNEGEINFSIDWEKQGEMAVLVIKVQDTGIGIKENDIDRLFNSFERMDEEKNHSLEGTGLGLAICKKLLELMDGKISVESEYGKGSIFTVTIKQKIVNDKPMQINDYTLKIKADEEEYFRAPDAKVLIVDDNLVNLRVAQGLLQIYDMKIDTVSSGKEALELLAYNYYDLVFMDHMMPELDGIEVVRIIRKEKDRYNQDIPVVALTANAVTGVREMFLKEGFKEHLAKPIEVKKLNTILLKFLPAHLIQKTGISSNPLNEVKVTKMNAKIEDLKIQGIDIEKGLRQVEYNDELYLDILKIYCKETLRLQEEIKDVEDKTSQYFITRVHAIKGSSDNLGITKIADQSRRLEKAARLRDMAFIEEKYPVFDEQMTQILGEISKFLKEIKEERQVEQTYLEEIEKSTLDALYEGFEEYDIKKLEGIFKDLENYRFPESIAIFLLHLKECVDNIEYEQGIQMLNDYVATLK